MVIVFSEECFVLVCKLSPINNATFDPKIWPVVRQVVWDLASCKASFVWDPTAMNSSQCKYLCSAVVLAGEWQSEISKDCCSALLSSNWVYLLQSWQDASRHRLQSCSRSVQDRDAGKAEALQQQSRSQTRKCRGRRRGRRQSFLLPGGWNLYVDRVFW